MKAYCPKFILFLFFFCIGNSDLLAQGAGQHRSKFIRKLQKTIWVAGLSGTVIDDDAKAFKDVFDVNNTWNFLYFPSKIDFEGFMINSLSLQGTFTYSQLREGKLIGEEKSERPDNVNLLAFDINTKFYPRELKDPAVTTSPYMIAGFGYTYRSLTERKSAFTFNVGLGLNIWMNKGFGLNVQSHAKFALNNASSKNYLQHSVGLIYRFSLLKGYRAVSAKSSL